MGGMTGYLAIPKTIMIYNPKLGVIMRGMQLWVVVFFCYQYVQDRSWMYETSTPEGFVSFWASTDEDSFREARDHEASGTMCSNAPEFAYEGLHKHVTPNGCIDPMPGDEWISMDASMFLPTFFEDTWIEQTAGDDDCSKLKDCCGGKRPAPAYCADFGFEDGEFEFVNQTNLLNQSMCRCERHRSFFVRGAEGIQVYLHPSYTMVKPDGTREAGTTSHKEDHIITLIKSPSHKEEEEDKKAAGGGHGGGGHGGGHSLMEPASLVEMSSSLPVEADKFEELDKYFDPPQPETTQVKSRLAKTPTRRASLQAAGRSALEVLDNGDARMYKEKLPASQPALVRREREAVVSNSSIAWLQQNLDIEFPRQQLPDTDTWASYLERQASYLGSKVRELSHPPETDENTRVTRMEPGQAVHLSLEKWLAKALLVEGQHGPPVALKDLTSAGGSILDAPNPGTTLNQIEGSKHKHPTFRTTGLELTIELMWMNAVAHKMKGHNGTVLEVASFARGGWHSKPSVYHLKPLDPSTGKSKSVRRNFNGVKVRFQTTGKFQHFSFVAVSTALSAIAIYIGIPVLIINALALNCLGHASTYYWMASRQLIYPKEMMLGLCARTFVLLRSLASGSSGKEQYTFAEIRDHLTKALGEEGAEVQQDAPILAKMVINQYGNAKTNTITSAQLANACLSDETIGAAEAAPLWIKDRDQGNAFSRAMNWLFVPDSDFPDRDPELMSEFTVTLVKKAEGASLGVDIDFSDGATIVITQVREGLVAEWNAANPAQLVKPDDRIVAVNGVMGNAANMMEVCKTAPTLELLLKRKVEDKAEKGGEKPEDGKEEDGKEGADK